MKEKLMVAAAAVMLALGGPGTWRLAEEWLNTPPTVEVWIYYGEVESQHQSDGDYLFYLDGWHSNAGQFYECSMSPEFYNAITSTRINYRYDFPARMCREVRP